MTYKDKQAQISYIYIDLGALDIWHLLKWELTSHSWLTRW